MHRLVSSLNVYFATKNKYKPASPYGERSFNLCKGPYITLYLKTVEGIRSPT